MNLLLILLLIFIVAALFVPLGESYGGYRPYGVVLLVVIIVLLLAFHII